MELSTGEEAEVAAAAYGAGEGGGEAYGQVVWPGGAFDGGLVGQGWVMRRAALDGETGLLGGEGDRGGVEEVDVFRGLELFPVGAFEEAAGAVPVGEFDEEDAVVSEQFVGTAKGFERVDQMFQDVPHGDDVERAGLEIGRENIRTEDLEAEFLAGDIDGVLGEFDAGAVPAGGLGLDKKAAGAASDIEKAERGLCGQADVIEERLPHAMGVAVGAGAVVGVSVAGAVAALEIFRAVEMIQFFGVGSWGAENQTAMGAAHDGILGNGFHSQDAISVARADRAGHGRGGCRHRNVDHNIPNEFVKSTGPAGGMEYKRLIGLPGVCLNSR